jgi:hypothetical protein
VPRSASRIILGLAASAAIAGSAGAQIIRRPVAARVQNWVGASVGITQGFTILDGSTGSTWDFGSGLDYAVRVEHPTSATAQLAVGLQGSFARLPVGYSSSSFSGDAKADLMQLMGLVRYGSGYGFHPVYELQAGVIGFSDFRSSGTPSVQISSSTDYDAKFSLGYGFGFGLSPSSSIEIVQELGTVLHQRTGLSASQSNYPRIYVTRLGGKIAF